MYFLSNASPKLLDIATSNFTGAYMSHDVEGTGQLSLNLDPPPPPQCQGQRYKSVNLQWCTIDGSLVF